MHIEEEYQQTDTSKIQNLIDCYPLAVLVGNGENGLVANHLPLFLRDGVLIGHIGIDNNLPHAIANNDDVLAIFRGEDAYISANWYPSKFIHHKRVPTWNYEAVHVHGKITFNFDGKAKKAQAVGHLTNVLEKRVNGKTAWKMADAPADYLKTMLNNIVSFQIQITKIIAKSKISQDKEDGDYHAVAENLDAIGKSQMAHNMRNLRKK